MRDLTTAGVWSWVERALWASSGTLAAAWAALALMPVEPPSANLVEVATGMDGLVSVVLGETRSIAEVSQDEARLFFVMDADCQFTERNFHNWRRLVETSGNTAIAVLSVSDPVSTKAALARAGIDAAVYSIEEERLEALGRWGFPMTIATRGQDERVAWIGYLNGENMQAIDAWLAAPAPQGVGGERGRSDLGVGS